MPRTLALTCLLAACTPTTLPAASDTATDTLPAAIELPADVRIEVESPGGDLQVFVVDRDVATVRAVSPDPDASWDYAQDGDTFRAWSVCANGQIGCATGFVLEVPAAQDLGLSCLSGTVRVEGAYAGAADIATRAGSVTAEALGAAALHIATESGDILTRFRATPTSLSATTATSDILAEVPAGVYQATVDTNGSQTVQGIQAGDGPPIALTSTSGAITLTGT